VPNIQITMANHISASASQAALSIEELVVTMRASGMSNVAIRQTLLNDLNSGGQLFGTFRNKIKNTVKNGVEFSSNDSANGEFTKAGVQEFKWISVGDNKVCVDCEGRHGETGTMEFFETIGLPASGFSVCTTNCRCQLVPENYKDENLDKPLVKTKKVVDLPLKVGKDTTTRTAELTAKKLVERGGEVSFSGVPLWASNQINKRLYKLEKQYGIKPKSVQTIKGDALKIDPKTGDFFIGREWINQPPDLISMNVWTSKVKAMQSNSFDDLITHEYGHLLTKRKYLESIESQVKGHRRISAWDKEAVFEEYLKIKKDSDKIAKVQTRFNKIKKGLSEYGQTRPEEGLAEIFVLFKQKGKKALKQEWIDFFNEFSEVKI